MHMKMIDASLFAWFLCSFEQPTCALAAYHLENVAMILHDAVGVNCKNGATTDITTGVRNI